MPFFSVMVASYNNAQYLPGCLESIRCQHFHDWEAIVVVDASPDDSAEIAHTFACKDPRFTVIEKRFNQGLHLARLTGVEASAGNYSLFLDADDELHSEALGKLHDALVQEPSDILHFGINVVNEGVSENERSSFESYVNKPLERLRGKDILRVSYEACSGYLQDWRVTQRVYETSLLKSAFKAMTTDRLEQAEDSYEYFVIAHMAGLQVTRNDIIALDYHYGRGLNSSSVLSASSFTESAQAFKRCIDAIEEYSSQANEDFLAVCADGAKSKLLDLLMNNWIERVKSADREVTSIRLSELFGCNEVSAQIARLARDVAYEQWINGDSCVSETEAQSLLDLAENLHDSSQNDGPQFIEYRASARNHIGGIKHRVKERHWKLEREQEPVRIFVTTHKPVDLFDSKVLQPVQVGKGERKLLCFHDDEGENIADLNPLYCELTTQYWAWKNVDAEYYGFCHYRRYFDFSPERHKENAWGEIIDGYIDKTSQRRYCLDDESIRRAVEGYDVITTEFKDLRTFPSGGATPVGHYKAAKKLHYADLEHVAGIVKDMHPDFAQDVDGFLNGHTACFCNMFIMRKSIFQDYCAWLFPILERFVDETDMSHYNQEALRTPGHLSERLFNIYFKHQMRTGAGWKTKQVQCVHFEHPEMHSTLTPLDNSDDGRSVIPVVFASDDNYVPMLTTTVYSALKNASDKYLYDVTILERDISSENQARMKRFFSKFSNVRLRFYNVDHIVGAYDLGTSNAHISIETYYRFLIQDVLSFYDKVLYLDSDIIVKGDISDLFNVNLGDNVLAAVHDLDYLGNLNMPASDRWKYSTTVLGMKDPYMYFQAGVLVLNTAAMHQLHTVKEWLEIASRPCFIYDDQDVLNAECEGRVTFLDYSWNVMIDCAGRINNVFSFAPADNFSAFLESRSCEKIVHYAGFEKPWNMAGCDRGELYWSYARETPYYEKLLALLSGANPSVSSVYVHPHAISETSPLRRVVDPLLPLGTRRREIVKALGRAIRGL